MARCALTGEWKPRRRGGGGTLRGDNEVFSKRNPTAAAEGKIKIQYIKQKP